VSEVRPVPAKSRRVLALQFERLCRQAEVSTEPRASANKMNSSMIVRDSNYVVEIWAATTTQYGCREEYAHAQLNRGGIEPAENCHEVSSLTRWRPRMDI